MIRVWFTGDSLYMTTIQNNPYLNRKLLTYIQFVSFLHLLHQCYTIFQNFTPTQHPQPITNTNGNKPKFMQNIILYAKFIKHSMFAKHHLPNKITYGHRVKVVKKCLIQAICRPDMNIKQIRSTFNARLNFADRHTGRKLHGPNHSTGV